MEFEVGGCQCGEGDAAAGANFFVDSGGLLVKCMKGRGVAMFFTMFCCLLTL